ncbi:MAG: four helix bundle protein [Balneolaceae bacterium]|nr:four helix bundle protein [Balneolaceae bacterium]
MSIASKEAREANYWLRLIDQSDFIEINVSEWVLKSNELVRILTSIVKSTQKNS